MTDRLAIAAFVFKQLPADLGREPAGMLNAMWALHMSQEG